MKVKIFFFIFINVLSIVLCAKIHNNDNKTLEITISRTACHLNEDHAQPSNRVDTSKKLAALRALMDSREEKLEAFLVTSGDEHQTEFVSDDDKRLQYISGFSGSNGNAIITLENAIFWTDGRYQIQANEELDCNWLLLKEWKIESFNEFLPNGAKIGADPKLIPAQMWENLESELDKLNKNFNLVQTIDNLVDSVWSDRKETDVKKGFTLDISYTGKTWIEKVVETRQKLEELEADGMVVTALDEIAWLLNIRGNDIPYTNLLKSYLILTQNETVLYADPRKINGNITTFFANSNTTNSSYTVVFKDYRAIWTDLPLYSQTQRILVPSSYGYSYGASKAILDLVPEDNRITKPSPIIDIKAKKNPTEILGMEKAHIRDGVAMCRFLEYFETRCKAGDEWDELKVSKNLNRFRAEQDLFINISFTTIAAFGAHGALPHYLPTKSSSSKIFDNSTLVIDSGGHYYDGTTDVTRTIHLGTPTSEQKHAYTKVLMGCIQMSSLIFPSSLGTSGIDVLARAPLWETGYDYPHGTGHGIGVFLNVHESPVNVFYGSLKSHQLKPGYFLSNEPGYYLDGEFGVRLENVMEVIKMSNLKTYRGKVFLGFKDVTLIPYDMNLVDFSLLENKHIRWLNKYNTRIRNLIGPELKRENAEDAFNWMMEKTMHIPETSAPPTSKPDDIETHEHTTIVE